MGRSTNRGQDTLLDPRPDVVASIAGTRPHEALLLVRRRRCSCDATTIRAILSRPCLDSEPDVRRLLLSPEGGKRQRRSAKGVHATEWQPQEAAGTKVHGVFLAATKIQPVIMHLLGVGLPIIMRQL